MAFLKLFFVSSPSTSRAAADPLEAMAAAAGSPAWPGYPPHPHHPIWPPHYPTWPTTTTPCPQICDLDKWPDCQCTNVYGRMYTWDGRGNCNVGATQQDLQVY